MLPLCVVAAASDAGVVVVGCDLKAAVMLLVGADETTLGLGWLRPLAKLEGRLFWDF